MDNSSAETHATIFITPLSIPALTWPARIVRSLFALKQVAPGAVKHSGRCLFLVFTPLAVGEGIVALS